MELYSTKNLDLRVSLKEAVFKGLPADNGLFMPVEIPQLPKHFFQQLPSMSLPEIAFEVSKTLLKGAVPQADLKSIIEEAISFPAPLVQLDEHKYVLELFHGPSLAFKDYGARFMSRLMSHFNHSEDKSLVILVATSGDTGGAVASGFYKTPGIEVVILYPSGKVSHLQEKQLTTLGHNITALEVDGTFDDCQALVKQAFLDQQLCKQVRLSSANSINIARLIPQSFYYFDAYRQLNSASTPLVFSVPSGNFGNLTAGLIAQKMGLPVHQFLAATNLNDVVPEYIHTSKFNPRPSLQTISNAMDVGNPSNFVRMLDMFHVEHVGENIKGSTWNNLKNAISGHAFNDESTRKGVAEVYQKFNYIIDPHGAVGYLALKEYQKINAQSKGIILETAHPSKFIGEVESILAKEVEIPERLASLADKEKVATQMSIEYAPFKDWLIEKYIE